MTGPCQGELTSRHWSMSPYWSTFPFSRPAGNLADASCTVDRSNTHGAISRNARPWLSAMPCHQWQLMRKGKWVCTGASAFRCADYTLRLIGRKTKYIFTRQFILLCYMFRLIQDHQQEEQPLKFLTSHNSYSQLPGWTSFKTTVIVHVLTAYWQQHASVTSATRRNSTMYRP
jgi:hypothetical protein